MAERNSKGHFKKGHSGNPEGRSKKARHIESLFQEALKGGISGNKALDTLLELMDNEQVEPKDRRACAMDLMAYAYGKPKQRKEITGEDGGPIIVSASELSDDHLAAIIAADNQGDD